MTTLELMLMCGKVSHKNLIGRPPLSRIPDTDIDLLTVSGNLILWVDYISKGAIMYLYIKYN